MATTAPRRLVPPRLPSLFLPVFLFLLSSLVSASLQTTPSVATIDIDTANRLLTRPTSSYRFLDVRTAKEFDQGHVRGAVNVPYVFFTNDGAGGTVRNPEFLGSVERAFSKGDPIVVGCLAGVRSLKAAKELVQAGFRDVKDLGGGYTDWVNKGLPVVKPSASSRYEDAEL